MAEAGERADRWRAPNGLALVAGLALAGLHFGLRPLSDNSFLTHLATGRLILERGSVPTTDPYSFTAAGEPWVVQSWLPALFYGVIDRIAGGAGLLALHAVLIIVLALLVGILTARLDSILPRVLVGSLALVIGGAFWSERPLLFGLVCFGLTLVVTDRNADPRWLVPVFAVWVASHGSFPLGFVLLLVLVAGAALDHSPVDHLRRCARWAAGGAVLGSLYPLGPKVLVFPLSLLAGGEVLEGVSEWQAPSFDSLPQRAWLLQLLLAVVLLVRRPSYRAAVPLVAFGGASLLALRNVPVASLALLPGMAIGAEGLGSISSRARSAVATLGLGAALLGAAASIVTAADRPAFSLVTYPVEVLASVRAELGPDVRIVAQDTVGNYRIAVLGEDAKVFYDDRFDMYSTDLAADHRALGRGDERWQEVLDRHRAEVVVWRRDRSLSTFLTLSPAWHVVAADRFWLAAARR